MLLQRLAEYAQKRMDLPPTLYAETPIRYVIELDAAGRLLSREPLDTADPANPKTKRGQRRFAPQVTRAVGIKPLLLADHAEYTLGLARETSKPDRVAACHQAYLDLLDRCVTATNDSTARAVQAFLRSDPVAQLALPADFDRSGLITFRVDDKFVIDQRIIQDFWAAENDPASKSAPVMQCLVCGEERPVLDRLQGKIKGIPGGQTAGTSIISANADAFESYGLSASLIAPTCAPCGERFTKAANALLADETSRFILGGAAFIFWTRREVGFNFRTYVHDPQPDEVRALRDALVFGKRQPEVDDTAFFAATLSASGGRVVVRNWIDTTVSAVKSALSRWFAWQEIVGPFSEAPRPLGLFRLAAATVREADDLAPPTGHALLHAALTGTPLPTRLLAQAVQRNRAEQTVTFPRAALIKLVLASQHAIPEDTMVKLDPNHPAPAYHCGRLLAVLERIQEAAIQGIKTTVADRYYGAASASPAYVFGRLLQGANPHLTKLKRDNPGLHYALNTRLGEVLGALGDFPATFTVRQQGLFGLGFYHQKAWDRAQAMEAATRRKADQAAKTQSTFDSTNQDPQTENQEA